MKPHEFYNLFNWLVRHAFELIVYVMICAILGLIILASIPERSEAQLWPIALVPLASGPTLFVLNYPIYWLRSRKDPR